VHTINVSTIFSQYEHNTDIFNIEVTELRLSKFTFQVQIALDTNT